MSRSSTRASAVFIKTIGEPTSTAVANGTSSAGAGRLPARLASRKPSANAAVIAVLLAPTIANGGFDRSAQRRTSARASI